jgi:phospholipase/carboxylesterase
MRSIDGPRLAPRAGGAPKKLVIFVHGYGANGQDLINIGAQWAAEMPEAQFIAPDAPDPVPGAPGGFQWFPISNLDPHRIEQGAREARPVLDKFIDQELARYRLTEKDLVLVGFSQGTMLSLETALRRERPVAGVLGYSGALPGGARLKEEMACKPPVFLIHGDQDQVLPIGFMFDALVNLAEAGHGAQWHVSRGVPHGIGPDGLELGARFVRGCLTGRI